MQPKPPQWMIKDGKLVCYVFIPPRKAKHDLPLPSGIYG